MLSIHHAFFAKRSGYVLDLYDVVGRSTSMHQVITVRESFQAPFGHVQPDCEDFGSCWFYGLMHVFALDEDQIVPGLKPFPLSVFLVVPVPLTILKIVKSELLCRISSGKRMIKAVADSVILRWRSKKSTRDSSPEPSLNSSLSESSTSPHSWFEIEVWVIDICTYQSTRILASADWMDAKMKISRKDLEVAWSHLAKLKPYCRYRILDFLNHRRDEEPGWTLCHFEVPHKWSPAKLFGMRRDDQMIQLTLSRPKLDNQDSDSPRGRPKIEGQGGGLPKRVAFGGELREESGTMGKAKSTNKNVLAMDTLDLRNKIAGLEKKKDGLGPHEYERLADLNDMIDYLRDRLESDAKMTSIYDKSQTEPGKSDSTREQVVIHHEQIPDSDRREIFIEEERYDRELGPRAPPRPRRVYGADDDVIARHRPRDEFEIIERESSPGKLDSEGQYVVRSKSRYGPSERPYREEEVYLEHRDSLPSRWQERSRSRSRPSRQDSLGPRGGPIVRRDRSWERPKDQTSQPSKQVSEEIDYYDYAQGGRVGHGRTRSRQSTVDRYEEDQWSPHRREIVIRRDERPHSRPRERQYFSSSGSEHNSLTSRIVRSERPAVDASGQSQALVVRAGASGLPYDYVRERVFNGGIRVRGDDHIGNSPDDSPGFSDDYRPRRRSFSRILPQLEHPVSPYIRRPSRPSSSRRGSYRDRSWAPSLRRRLSETWHQFDSSEDEGSRYRSMKRVDSEKNGPETELSDAEVIAQTLKQLTTIQDSDMPATGTFAPPTRTKSEVGPSALKNALSASTGPERQRSFPVSGRKAHFEQDIGPIQPDQHAQSGATKEGSKPADEEPFLDRISEEPDAITEDNEIPHHQRVVYFPERPISSTMNQRSSFPHPPDLAPGSREASPRRQSPRSSLDSPRSTSANGPIILEHHGYPLASQREETRNQAAQEEEHEKVEVARTISRNPTVREEVDGVMGFGD